MSRVTDRSLCRPDARGGGRRGGTLRSSIALKQRAGGIVVPIADRAHRVLHRRARRRGDAAQRPQGALAYRDIFNGAGLNWIFHPTTTSSNIAAYNLSQTLLQTTTLILTGLAVAFAFRCGMFNIGGQGQYFIGLIVANWVGVSLRRR